MIKISIVTVCYNAKDKLKKTIDSVCYQTYSNIEYLIIDGASTDKTLDMLQKYKKKEKIYIYSEKDSGIYNAMNRGIAKASGHYIFFLNAGDILYNEFVIENVVSYIEDLDTIYFGKVCLVYADGLKYIQNFNEKKGTLEEKIYRGGMPCHQSIFAPRNTLISHNFREEYKICADFEWFIYSVNRGYKCKDIPVVISYYDVNGMSSRLKENKQLRKEKEMILCEYQNELLRYGVSDFTEFDQEEIIGKYVSLFQLMSNWIALKQRNFSIAGYLKEKNYKRIAIYGMSHMGVRLLEELVEQKVEVVYAIDRDVENLILDIKIVLPNDELEDVDVIIVTAIDCFYEIQNILNQKIKCPIISLEDIIYDIIEKLK